MLVASNVTSASAVCSSSINALYEYFDPSGTKDRVCREYALAEKRGDAPRRRNNSGLSPEEYARALWRDGKRRDWF
jgi:hypothetical protein